MVELQPCPFAELLKKETETNASGLYRAAWTADYPSAENFLFPLLSKSSLPPGDNRGRYHNPKFDDLLAQARKAPDEAKRAELIKQAEKVAIGEDLALIPLWYRTSTGSSTRPSGRASARLLREPHPGHHQPEVMTRLIPWAGTSSGGCCR